MFGRNGRRKSGKTNPRLPSRSLVPSFLRIFLIPPPPRSAACSSQTTGGGGRTWFPCEDGGSIAAGCPCFFRSETMMPNETRLLKTARGGGGGGMRNSRPVYDRRIRNVWMAMRGLKPKRTSCLPPPRGTLETDMSTFHLQQVATNRLTNNQSNT